jgi:tRNA nucleotidyltransferase (CCA-adding enzyme)
VERSSIKLDLHRRDFTINTMAVRLDGRHYGELLDHWGGYGDLKKGVIRVLHSLSFIDDPTRALRAVRFEQRFNFKIEQRTQDLMIEAAGQLKAITGERLRHEFDLILAEEKAPQMLQRLNELNLLASIHSGLIWEEENTGRMSELLNTPPPSEWELPDRMWGYPLRRVLGYTFWFMNFPQNVIKSVTRRLRIPGNIEKVILDANVLVSGIGDLVGKPPSVISAYMADKNAAAILCVYHHLESPEQRWLLEQYQTTWQKIEPTIDGRDLSALGLPPGPHFKQILVELKGAWLDGKINSKSEEQKYLSALLKAYSI